MLTSTEKSCEMLEGITESEEQEQMSHPGTRFPFLLKRIREEYACRSAFKRGRNGNVTDEYC